MEFRDLAPFQEAFEHYLQLAHIEENEPKLLFSPIRYILSMGGKRIRPILTLLAYQLFNEDYHRALPQSLAIETFHNFTLAHDDIMDQAPKRRGLDTVHEKFGINAAILSGDAMLIMAYEYLITGLDAKQVPLAVSLFSKTALDICRGQQLDMDFEHLESVSIDAYLQMIEFKTAVLLGLSMALGGIVASANEEAISKLHRCGVAAGMAFQIHDDYLDAFGDSKLTGKQRGGDIIQNKKTFLWLKAYEVGGDRLRQELVNWSRHTGDPAAKVRRVLEIYQSLDIEGHCQQKQKEYTDQAIDALNELRAPISKKQWIFDLMALLLNRDH